MNNNSIDNTSATEAPAATVAPRLQINLAKPLHLKTTAALMALAERNDKAEPTVLVRGNELVRMTERGALEPWSTVALRDRLSETCEFGRYKDGEWCPGDPPKEISETVIHRDSGDYDGLPRVDRVVDVPVVAPDGSMVERPGHHPEGKLYYRPASALEGLEAPPPDGVGPAEVESAVELLADDLMGDFAFGDDASRANALAMLLTPFVRDYVDGPTPLFVIYAHGPGWGKDWLTDAALVPGCGKVPKSPGASDDDEWRKRITAALRKAPAAVVFDNLSGTIDSGSLAHALTADIWEDRILGESRTLVAPVRNLWTANGNNISLSPELADRSVPITLAPRDDEGEVVAPRHRPRGAWTHPDLPAWALQNRARLAFAALTLVRHWLDGRVQHQIGESISRVPEEREYPDQSMGSFADWAGVVGGILKAAEIEGFLENRDTLVSELTDDAGDGTAEFLARWHAIRPGERMTSGELSELCGPGGELAGFVPDTVADGKLSRQLGYWLADRKGNWINGYRLMRTEAKSGGRYRWYVVPAD